MVEMACVSLCDVAWENTLRPFHPPRPVSRERDFTGTLTFREGVEIVAAHERALGMVHIPLIHVQRMETAD
jgi:hypothetical protein